MRKFHIFHCVHPSFNEDYDQLRDYEATIEASSLQDAYVKSQNLTEEGWNGAIESRSTSVGDLIQDAETEEVFMVMGFGFKSMGIVEFEV
jgi:hypothetical protein